MLLLPLLPSEQPPKEVESTQSVLKKELLCLLPTILPLLGLAAAFGAVLLQHKEEPQQLSCRLASNIVSGSLSGSSSHKSMKNESLYLVSKQPWEQPSQQTCHQERLMGHAAQHFKAPPVLMMLHAAGLIRIFDHPSPVAGVHSLAAPQFLEEIQDPCGKERCASV